VTLKCRLGNTHPANLYTICTSIKMKSTKPLFLLLIVWVCLHLLLHCQLRKKLYSYIGCAFRSASSLKSPAVVRHRTLVHSSVWPTYRLDELSALPTLAASSSHSPTGPLLAIEPFLKFPVAGHQVWNCLPPEVTSAPSLDTFRRRLKTHLFTVSYSNIQYYRN